MWISTVPSANKSVLRFAVPTTTPLSVMFTIPLVNPSPVVRSVTLTLTVILPAVALITSAVTLLSRWATLKFNVVLVSLYVLSPGYEIVISLSPTSSGTVILPSTIGTSTGSLEPGRVTFTAVIGISSPVTGSVRFTLMVTLPWVAFTTSVINSEALPSITILPKSLLLSVKFSLPSKFATKL